MGKIRILPDNLVSKIAAGEIVERPASVVKELLENSIDAGSTMVKIELEAGGKRLIRVSDDGVGMTRDEALLSLERHATSKIRDINDLFSVTSLGFRGEAVPSIASVSRFRLTTKPEDEVIGTEITVEGGKIRKVEESGSPRGTTVEVRNIFYNTPARHKFMRKTETELTNVLGIAERIAVSRPDCSFELTHGGKTLLSLPRRDKTYARVSEIFPNRELYRIQGVTDGVKITGYMSGPLDTRSNTQKLFTFVNGRGVKDRFLTRMLIDAYGKMLEKGKFPQGAVFLAMPPGNVDVNVHPTKNEVRFQNTRLVGDLIKSSIASMLRDAPWLKNYQNRTVSDPRAYAPVKEIHSHYTSYHADRPVTLKDENTGAGVPAGHIEAETAAQGVTEESPGRFNNDDKPAGLFGGEGFYSSLKIIGQLGDLYIVCAYGDGMILIDQHAAHERINYERLKNAYLELRPLEVQELLVPEVVELSAHEAKLMEGKTKELEALGLRVEDFGTNSVVLRSAPALLKNADYSVLLKDIIAEIGENDQERSLSDRIDRVISTMACHSSIRANFELNTEKMTSLLKELDRSEFPHSCPHGRPVAQRLSYQEIERMFKRT